LEQFPSPYNLGPPKIYKKRMNLVLFKTVAVKKQGDAYSKIITICKKLPVIIFSKKSNKM